MTLRHQGATANRSLGIPGLAVAASAFDDAAAAFATAHWPLRESSGTTFSEIVVGGGTHDATGSGEIEYVAGTIAQNDTSGNRCLGLGGGADTSRLNISSHSTFAASAGGWFVLIQPDQVSAKTQLVSRSGATAGGFALEQTSAGGIRVFRYDGSGNLVALSSSGGLLTVGEPVLVGITWGTNGLRAWIGETVVASEGTPTTDWASTNTDDISVFRWITGVDGYDGLGGHLMFRNTEPGTTDIATVNLPLGLSILTGTDLGTVEENQTQTVDPKNHGHFKGSLTLSKPNPQPQDGTLAINGEVFDYTAGGTADPNGDTFGAGVQDDRTTVEATFSIEVVEAGAVSLLGSWPLSETSGTTFADATGSNDATLQVPSWTVETHIHDRPGIASGLTDTSLEISNGGPVIPMIASYQQPSASLVLYVDPLSELRGLQYWDDTDERFGREFLAFCDDGSTPGSFAIYRRRPSYDLENRTGTSEWRLGGYVRDSNGDKEYFGGSLSGIATALLPVDTTKRIVLTQGSAGAELWVGIDKVATLTTTEGWDSLTEPIRIGAGSDEDKPYDRSPAWARVQEIRIYSGQFAQENVNGLPSVQQSKRWKPPSDFVGAGTDIDIADHSGAASPLQSAVDAADAAGVYVFQDDADSTVYIQPADDAINWKASCKGAAGVKIRKANGESNASGRIVQIDVVGTFSFTGCDFDGNARNQDWHPRSGEPGFTFNDFDLQQAHALRVDSPTSGSDINVTVDACHFHDGTADACAAYNRSKWTVRSTRFVGYFRGALVVNSDAETEIDARNCESFAESRDRPGVYNGCGICDIEPFGGGVDDQRSVRVRMADYWGESDYDDGSRQDNASFKSWTRTHNLHVLGSPWQTNHTSSATSFASSPISDCFHERCTFSYWRTGQGGGSFPPVRFIGIGPGDNGYGILFNHCVFLAWGEPYVHHEDSLLRPEDDSTLLCEIEVQNPSGDDPTGRYITIRNSEVRPYKLPAGMSQSNKMFLDFAAFTTAQEIELDGLTIDGEFADNPMEMGGVTVRHRNVIHERTSDTTPWTGAGAEVAI